MDGKTTDNVTVIGTESPQTAQKEQIAKHLTTQLFNAEVPEMDLIPVLFTWNLPSGDDIVYLSGTFNEWSERIPLQVTRESSRTIHGNINADHPVSWHTTLLLPPGLHALRFIVEGKWRINPELPIRKDSHGNEFNAIYIKSPDHTQDDKHPWITEPWEVQGRPFTLTSTLTQSHLNYPIQLPYEHFLLPFPPPSSEEHLCVSVMPCPSLVASAVTIRIRDKFVTSQLIHYNKQIYQNITSSHPE
ncbi:putative Glycogen recognition site of AMP-activated protein kinase [Blattamonas nauphoetae]|uniref:Glycogen recognition site of AMP-activated protein kinase n=1 Tax=Blattamonas nauphoetae TaxID=2049346 RepID=A0ABQ9YHR1_9EUKA|nr:putative Glycogen recognition site of AMP-activated protein kinase [Blattamonas nauphoetae]